MCCSSRCCCEATNLMVPGRALPPPAVAVAPQLPLGSSSPSWLAGESTNEAALDRRECCLLWLGLRLPLRQKAGFVNI